MAEPIRRVGFIGTGVMGASMAGHLIDAGFELTVHNRTRERAEGLLARGAAWADTPGDAAVGAHAVVSIVGYPADVEAVYLGEGGVVASAAPGTLLVDMTTSSPGLAARIARAAGQAGCAAVDAPVSGGDVGARNGTLTIMAGGDEAAFARAMPLFEAMGRTVIHHGQAGAGQHCKMANQIAIAASMLGLAECLAYAKAAQLDPERVLATLGGGSAQTWTLDNYGPRVLADDYAPGFFIKHFVKDLKIALSEAESRGVDLPGTALARKLYGMLESEGGSELGTQAIWLLYAEAEARAAHGVAEGATAGSA